MYSYMYIYICVCVCVCVSSASARRLPPRHRIVLFGPEVDATLLGSDGARKLVVQLRILHYDARAPTTTLARSRPHLSGSAVPSSRFGFVDKENKEQEEKNQETEEAQK